MKRIKLDKSGSRDSDGNVPNANWNDDKFRVNWNYSNNHNDNLRSRSEVFAITQKEL